MGSAFGIHGPDKKRSFPGASCVLEEMARDRCASMGSAFGVHGPDKKRSFPGASCVLEEMAGDRCASMGSAFGIHGPAKKRSFPGASCVLEEMARDRCASMGSAFGVHEPDKKRSFPPSIVLEEIEDSALGVHHPASSGAGACARACLEQASTAAIANFIVGARSGRSQLPGG